MKSYPVQFEKRDYVAPPSKLYRFRSFSNLERAEVELRELFESSRVWVSNPGGMNDVHDCKIAIRTSRIAFFVEGLRKLVAQEGIREKDRLHILDCIDHFSNISPHERMHFQLAYVEDLAVHLTSHTLVGCFAQNYQSLAMWNHYANSYKGVCYEIEADTSFLDDWAFLNLKHPGRQIYEVTYKTSRTSYPSIDIARMYYLGPQKVVNFFQFMQNSFFEKSKDWEYEQEVRVIQNMKFPTEKGT